MEGGQNVKRRLLGNFLHLSRPEREKGVETRVQNGKLTREKDTATAASDSSMQDGLKQQCSPTPPPVYLLWALIKSFV